MINNDQDFFALVNKIAEDKSVEDDVHEAAGYLWDTNNWERLKNTNYGRFIRETVSPAPDYTLRAVYRKLVINNG